MAESHISVESLRFSRGSRAIFDDISLEIPRGKVTAIMGPSGTGKTTLLKLIGGQLTPHAGAVRVNGRVVHELTRAETYALRKQMGMLFQSGALLTDLSVFENVAFPLREHTRLPEPMLRDLVLMKLQAVGLRGAVDLMPSELSGGMARRVALARAIALDPDLIMYDEPFTGLDPITKATIVSLIRRLNDTLGITSLVVSHDVGEVLSIADYAYIISNGRIIAGGTAAALKASDSPWVQQFLQALPDGPVPFHYPAEDYAANLLGGARG